LHKLLDVKLALFSAYRPQTDGQTEVMNKTLKTMLEAFVDNTQLGTVLGHMERLRQRS